MLIIEGALVKEHFVTVLAFAHSKGEKHVRWFWEQMWKLHTFGNELKKELGLTVLLDRDNLDGLTAVPPEWNYLVKNKQAMVLFKDSAPASFNFNYIDVESGRTRFNGGLVYHGDQSGWVMPNGQVIPPGHGVETFSVNIEPMNEYTNPWSMHT
jgi:hypothetical protein